MANDWRDLVDEVIALQSAPGVDTAPAPSLQWFPQQWLGDAAVQLMTMTARGCHHHLLMTAWKGFDFDGNAIPCSLPDDEDILGSVCQYPEEWPRLWSQVRRAWKLREGRWWNLGLVKSYLRQMEKRAKATASADARWSKKNANASKSDANASKSDANAGQTQCSSASASASAPATKEENPKKDSPCSTSSNAPPKRTKRQHFDFWWEEYPRKVGKPKAIEHWMKISKAAMPTGEEVVDFIRRAMKTRRWRAGYVKDGSAFVNQKAWEDDLAAYEDPGRGRSSGELEPAPKGGSRGTSGYSEDADILEKAGM